MNPLMLCTHQKLKSQGGVIHVRGSAVFLRVTSLLERDADF